MSKKAKADGKLSKRDGEVFRKYGHLPPDLCGDEFHEKYETIDYSKLPDAKYNLEKLEHYPEAIRMLEKTGGQATEEQWMSVVPTYGGIQQLTEHGRELSEFHQRIVTGDELNRAQKQEKDTITRTESMQQRYHSLELNQAGIHRGENWATNEQEKAYSSDFQKPQLAPKKKVMRTSRPRTIGWSDFNYRQLMHPSFQLKWCSSEKAFTESKIYANLTLARTKTKTLTSWYTWLNAQGCQEPDPGYQPMTLRPGLSVVCLYHETLQMYIGLLCIGNEGHDLPLKMVNFYAIDAESSLR